MKLTVPYGGEIFYNTVGQAVMARAPGSRVYPSRSYG